MATISMEAGMLGARLLADARGAPIAIRRAIFSAAQRGRSWIVGKTPVYRGILKNAWRVLKVQDGAELVNDQPYAGVMEKGARPFKMSKAGIEALTLWVKRKLLDKGSFRGKALSEAAQRQKEENQAKNKASRKSKQYGPRLNANKSSIRKSLLDKEAEKIAWAIARKFARVGMRGKRFVWRNLEILAGLMEKEIDRFLSKFFNRSQGQTP